MPWRHEAYIFYRADLELKCIVGDANRYHKQDRIENKGVDFSENISFPGEL
jgi:hypothetical protein